MLDAREERAFFLVYIFVKYFNSSWLRHYATSQKVMGLNRDQVIGFLN
jgi:hypothetical protein